MTLPVPTNVKVTETTADLSHRLSPMPDAHFGTSSPRGIPVIQIDDLATYQHVSGVGGAMTDSSAWLIHDRLDGPARRQLLQKLFGSSGIHLTLLRVPIAASDFTAQGRPYSYDDLPPGQSDPSLLHFSLAHDLPYVIPSLRQVLAIDPKIETLATPWSAPPWMKGNDRFDDLNYSGPLLRRDWKPFADYFVKFLRGYARRGVPIREVTPENEPDSGAAFPAMHLAESDEASWIVHQLGPALRRAGLKTKIYGVDTGLSDFSYSRDLISSNARGLLAGIAEHCYSASLDVLSRVHALDPALDLVLSECAPEITPYAPYAVPEIVMGSMRNWARAVALWNLALDPSGGPVQPPDSGCGGCRGIVTIDEASHTVTYNLPYYQLGQFGRYLQPGAQRIRSNHFVRYYDNHDPTPSSGDSAAAAAQLHRHQYGVTPGLDDIAFVNPDGRRVLVAYNNSTRAIRFAVTWHGLSFTYRLPANATATFVWNRSV